MHVCHYAPTFVLKLIGTKGWQKEDYRMLTMHALRLSQAALFQMCTHNLQ